MSLKYNTDPKFKAMADKVVGSSMGLNQEIENPNGWTFEDNEGALGQSVNQWNSVGLWSVGATATKTAVVNQKMMAVAKDAMKFGSDPVYGPWISKQQEILGAQLEAGFNKY
jgi:hypothetical protein